MSVRPGCKTIIFPDWTFFDPFFCLRWPHFIPLKKWNDPWMIDIQQRWPIPLIVPFSVSHFSRSLSAFHCCRTFSASHQFSKMSENIINHVDAYTLSTLKRWMDRTCPVSFINFSILLSGYRKKKAKENAKQICQFFLCLGSFLFCEQNSLYAEIVSNLSNEHKQRKGLPNDA